MNQIKFSHSYPKLWNQTKAELLAVKVIEAKDVQENKDLLEYDTRFSDPELPGLYKYYPLPKSGKLIQLMFLGDKGIPFCTIRPMFNGQFNKLPYYMKNIGYMFDIVIEKAVE